MHAISLLLHTEKKSYTIVYAISLVFLLLVEISINDYNYIIIYRMILSLYKHKHFAPMQLIYKFTFILI